MAATGGLGGKTWEEELGGRRATYMLAAAEAAAIRLHIAEFPKLLHGVKGLHLHIAATATEVGR